LAWQPAIAGLCEDYILDLHCCNRLFNQKIQSMQYKFRSRFQENHEHITEFQQNETNSTFES
jgi:hypothetical protein